jgi:two-component system, OmpR family, response regulator
MSGAKILLVEDEKNFGIVMRDYLRMNDFDVTLCEDGLLGLANFNKDKFDVCIVDVMMPKMDGFTLVEEIRKSDAQVPVLFLTARSMRDDMLKGYKAGADDYIIKPFDTELLLLKLHAILKRSAPQINVEQVEYSFSEFRYSHQHRLLSHVSGKQNKLSPKESDLLNLLLVNRNKVVSKSILLQKIWKTENYFTGRSMDVYIVKLRKYLETDKSVTIENIHGSGYCLKIAV